MPVPTTAPPVPLELLQKVAKKEARRMEHCAEQTSRLLLKVASETGPKGHVLRSPKELERPSFELVLGLCGNICFKTQFFRSIRTHLHKECSALSSFEKMDIANLLIGYVGRKKHGRVDIKPMNLW